MIDFQHIQLSYGAHQVLTDVTFEIHPGEKVGLIGRNGSGKTTLFQLLNGSLQPDMGQISIRKNSKIGCLAQIPEYENNTPVYAVLEQSFREIRQWQQRMKQIELRMSDPAHAESEAAQQLLQEYGQLQEKFEQADGYEINSRIDRVANGLGIPPEDYHRQFSSLSGGEKTKVGLAALLLTQPNILLLDEPTNHLDMSAIEWLEQFLASYKDTVIVISHDRYFLDRVVKKVIELEDGEIITYHTNYTNYHKEKEERLLAQFASYQEQQKKIKKMQESIKQLIEWGNRSNPPNPGFHRRAASMQKALDRIVKLKRPLLERKKIDLVLQQSDRSGKQVLTLQDISKSFADRTLLHRVCEQLFYGERIMLIGKNGCGKSTLLKAIMGQEQLDAGEIRLGSRVEIGYLAQESAPMENKQTVLQFFRTKLGMEEGEARQQLAKFLFYGSDVFKEVRSLSGGEWSRLHLALLMYLRPNLLLLDEPTNHLDIDSREALEEALQEFPGTLLAVSHDRYFINRLAHKVWSLNEGQITTYLGNYNHYVEKRSQQATTSNSDLQNKVYRNTPSLKVDRTDKVNNGIVSAKGPGRKNDVGSAKSSHATRPTLAVSHLEQEITELEQHLLTLDAQMLAPAVCSNPMELALLQQQRETAEHQLDILFRKWLNVTEN